MGSIDIVKDLVYRRGDKQIDVPSGDFKQTDKNIFFDSQNNSKPAYTKDMKNVFSNSVFDLMRNHNQVLDVVDVAKANGLIDNKPKTLIHFDSHSDLYNNDKSDTRENIGNYINKMVDNGTVNDVYWVVPDETRNSNQSLTINNSARNKEGPYVSGPKEDTIYVDNSNKTMSFEKPKDYDPKKYSSVPFHKVTANELPSFKNNSNKNEIIVDIDQDYFSNSGNDTFDNFAVKPNKQELQSKFGNFVGTLKDKDIHPVLTTVSQSPEYVNEGDKDALNTFSRFIGQNSKTDDYLANYNHNNISGVGITPPGKNVLTSQNKDAVYLRDLLNNDTHMTQPDEVLVIDQKNKEYQEAVKLFGNKYKLDAPAASKIINDLDKKDGTVDGVVDMKILEELFQNGSI